MNFRRLWEELGIWYTFTWFLNLMNWFFMTLCNFIFELVRFLIILTSIYREYSLLVMMMTFFLCLITTARLINCIIVRKLSCVILRCVFKLQIYRWLLTNFWIRRHSQVLRLISFILRIRLLMQIFIIL